MLYLDCARFDIDCARFDYQVIIYLKLMMIYLGGNFLFVWCLFAEGTDIRCSVI